MYAVTQITANQHIFMYVNIIYMSENFNNQPTSENANVQLREFINKLEEISNKLYPEGDRLMNRFIAKLKTEGIAAAKIFISSESDKFRSYGEETLYLIIDQVFNGSGSPWRSLEQRRGNDESTGLGNS